MQLVRRPGQMTELGDGGEAAQLIKLHAAPKQRLQWLF